MHLAPARMRLLTWTLCDRIKDGLGKPWKLEISTGRFRRFSLPECLTKSLPISIIQSVGNAHDRTLGMRRFQRRHDPRVLEFRTFLFDLEHDISNNGTLA